MLRITTIAATILLLCTTGFPQSSSSALINEALDKQFKIDIQNKTPLPQVLSAITDDTGVRIDVDPRVYELLPWGEQTSLAAKIENQTLREGLEVITRRLGLTFELQPEAVVIKPVPALSRLGRRANVNELQVLDLLATTPAQLQSDQPTVRELLAAVDAKLEASKSAFAVENRAFMGDAGNQRVPVPRNATLMTALEGIPQATNATWLPWGKTLVVLPKEEQIRDQLSKTISVRFNGVDIAQVLAELSSRSGVPFTFEPGALQRIPPDSRNVGLILDASIQQALENIAGFTGLAYVVNENGVYIWNPSPAAVGSGRREPVVAMLPLDNGVEMLLTESQLGPELREYLKHKTEKKLEDVRQQMKEEGFVPSTQPATRPAQPAPAPAPTHDL